MTVTNTLAIKKAYAEAGISDRQADTMAILDEQHAEDTAVHISRVFAADFARFESKIDAIKADLKADLHATVRQQTWSIIAFGFAIAGIAVTIATLLRR